MNKKRPAAEVRIPHRHYHHKDAESPDTDNIDGHDPLDEAATEIIPPDSGSIPGFDDSLNEGRKTQDDDE